LVLHNSWQGMASRLALAFRKDSKMVPLRETIKVGATVERSHSASEVRDWLSCDRPGNRKDDPS
jgi:hypothetical protein